MDGDRSGTEWISEFLEWTFSESERNWADWRAYDDTVMAGEIDGEVAGAYLEWIDASSTGAAAMRSYFGIDRRGIEGGMEALEISRERMLLIALRAEEDCVHMLRQVLETEGAEPVTLRRAIEGLDSVAAQVHALADKVLALHPH